MASNSSNTTAVVAQEPEPGLAQYNARCGRISNDASSLTEEDEDSPNPLLTVCNRTEYRCGDDQVAQANEKQEQGGVSLSSSTSGTIQFRYDVTYAATLDPSNVLLYLQDTVLEHVAHGLNLTHCRRRRRRRTRWHDATRWRTLQQDKASTSSAAGAAYAVSSLPAHRYLAPPVCDDDNSNNTSATTCTAEVEGAVTVWAATSDGAEAAALLTRGRIQDVMAWLPAPGRIARVDFVDFVNTPTNDVAATSSAWSPHRIVLAGAIGGGSLCLLLLLLACSCFWCCRRRRCDVSSSGKQQHRRQQKQSDVKKRNYTTDSDNHNHNHRRRRRQRRQQKQHWETLDDPQVPIAQRDSLALRPAGSWRMLVTAAAARSSLQHSSPAEQQQQRPPGILQQQQHHQRRNVAVAADRRSEATGDLTSYDPEEFGIDSTDESGVYTTTSSVSGDRENYHTDSERLVGVGIVNSSSSGSTDKNVRVESSPLAVNGGGIEIHAPTRAVAVVKPDDPYVLRPVCSDEEYLRPAVAGGQWRILHSLDGGSTEGYDDEIIEALGHITFGDDASASATARIS